MESDYCMSMTTTENEDGAATLARQVVEARLAACVQIVRIRSVFAWDGAVNDTPEQLLLIKTRTDEAFIRDHHPYDVPEILQVPIVRVGLVPGLGR